MPLLEVTDLHVQLPTRRGWAPVLRGISFTLERGDTLGLIGESGSGKSMVALALMGLLPDGARTSGSIRLNGQELLGLPDAPLCHIRGQRIGMVFQEPMTALNPLHRIGHQVAEPLRLHQGLSARAAQQAALALLERVGISDAAQRMGAYPHQFSGGQRQRITLAMALAGAPQLLIADEPTTALDVTLQRQILDLLAELVAERGMALLLISHDLGVMARQVRRLLVMYGASVVESGPTTEIFQTLAHPYTRGLWAARPRWGVAYAPGPRPPLPTIAGTVPDVLDVPTGCPFAGRCAFTADICHTTAPPPTLLAEGHSVRCLRLDVLPALDTHQK